MPEIAPPIDLDVKAVGDDGEFSGYASTFGNVDSYGDMIEPGAFTKSLAARPAGKVKLLWQHRQDTPIGVWTELREDARGLLAKGRILLSTTAGREAHALLKAGALDGLSIGFRTGKATHGTLDGRSVRRLQEIDLLEVSLVTFPANGQATVSAVKRADELASLLSQINTAREAVRRSH